MWACIWAGSKCLLWDSRRGHCVWVTWGTFPLLLTLLLPLPPKKIMGLCAGLISSFVAHVWPLQPLFNMRLWQVCQGRLWRTDWTQIYHNLQNWSSIVRRFLFTRGFTNTIMPRNSPGNLYFMHCNPAATLKPAGYFPAWDDKLLTNRMFKCLIQMKLQLTIVIIQ